MINKQSYQIVGMKQDSLVGTASSNRFAHEIMNLRFNTVGDYTTASWTTEEGTLAKPVDWQQTDALTLLEQSDSATHGIIPIGQAVINNQWVIFATQTKYDTAPRVGYDYILKIQYVKDTDNLEGWVWYAGNLNFDAKHPCETLPFYENENIQKVYWTDGKNQPRVVNIAGDKPKYAIGLDGQFDFVQEVELKEKVTITKRTDGSGLFPPCTVKYCITYYKKYGQSTNIVYDSPLYYPIKGQRGCSPDELSGDSFEIKVSHIDTIHGFDYIRLYSIVRTSEDATPIVRIVADKAIDEALQDPSNPNYKYVLFIDTNTTGEIVDPTILQYIGGNEVVVQTFDQKNNTLFAGNIELKQRAVSDVLNNNITSVDKGFVRGDYKSLIETFNKGGYGDYYTTKEQFAYDLEKAIGIRTNMLSVSNRDSLTPISLGPSFVVHKNNDTDFYQYSNQMTAVKHWHSYVPTDGSKSDREHNGNSQRIKIFKYGEHYRFGVQFQNTKGCWSEVMMVDSDAVNTVKPKTDDYSSVGIFGIYKYQLNHSDIVKLLNAGYVKARLVCCYPNNADRSFLAQGVICPTLSQASWQSSHAPDYFSSWFFRPIDEGDGVESIPYKNDEELAISTKCNCEVQSTVNSDSNFKVSTAVVTLHSPEITFDETIRTLDLNNVDIRTIGYVPINSWAAHTYIEATEPFPDYYGNKGAGLQYAGEVKPLNTDNDRWGSHFIHQGEYFDRDYYREYLTSNNYESTYNLPYIIYPFHRKGSLANYIVDKNKWIVSVPKKATLFDWNNTDPANYYVKEGSVLQNKVLSNLLYSASTVYKDTPYGLGPTKSINSFDSSLSVFDSNEVIPEKLTDGTIYYGNLNSIAPITKELIKGKQIGQYSENEDNFFVVAGAYPLLYWKNRYNGEINLNNNNDKKTLSSDPVPITFNSTAHGLFKANFSDSSQIYAEDVTLSNAKKPYLHLVDIYKKVSDEVRFGGTSNANNVYIPCGPTVDLRREYDVHGVSKDLDNYTRTLLSLEGDHYFMRYDCLKTYPRTAEDLNGIVEILSFMTETRVNLDGRYDRNRGLSDNTTITNSNFNLINMSYTQSNNFFTYFTLDADDSKLDKFANQITWTKTKTSGEDVDTWTNLTLVNTADAEGVCGKINKIINYKDNLYEFQDHGIAQIGYNEKTALSVENGVPLEIANSGKFSGLNYITKEIGCQNKWSICANKNGVLFIDDSRQELCSLGENVTSLSTQHGFDAFLIQQLPDSEHFTTWTPLEPYNFITFYDRLGNDTLFVNKECCLAFNEQTGTFTSFYSYNDVPLMANIGTHLLMWQNIHLSFATETTYVSEEVVIYEPVITTDTQEITYTEVSGTTTQSSIFNDENYLDWIVYEYISDSELNATLEEIGTGSFDYNNPPTTYYRRVARNAIQSTWGRLVVEPQNYTSKPYLWSAHFILSLEFKKDDKDWIIQIEVDGRHYYSTPLRCCQWDTENRPKLRLRLSENVTEDELNTILSGIYLGGRNQPTLNFGNVVYSGGRYKSNGTQPWTNTDSSFIVLHNGTSREFACIVKLYDLTKVENAGKYISANPITSIQRQGHVKIDSAGNNYDFTTVFRDIDIMDSVADIDSSEYSKETLVYDTTSTTEYLETQTVEWTKVVTTRQKPITSVIESTTNIWAARENPNCCQFFGKYEPYWITIVCDGIIHEGNAFGVDKVFNNIEYRADVFDRISTTPRANINLPVFDKIAAFNGYQIYKEFDIDAVRKFETWRANLPRATYMDSNNQLYTTRDRIRNPFCYIKLKQSDPRKLPNRMILHDLMVYFDMQ